MNFTLRQLGIYFQKLPKRLEKAAVRGMQKGAQQALPIFQRAGDTAPPASPNGSVGAFNTGAYRRGWKTAKMDKGVRIYNAMAYANIIDGAGKPFGRRPGAKMPPRAAIEAWARRKLKLSPKKAKQAAWPIARAIARRGLRARRVESRAAAKATAAVLKGARREVALALRGTK